VAIVGGNVSHNLIEKYKEKLEPLQEAMAVIEAINDSFVLLSFVFIHPQ